MAKTKGVIVCDSMVAARDWCTAYLEDSSTLYLLLSRTNPYATKLIRGLGKTTPWTLLGMTEAQLDRSTNEALHLRFGQPKTHEQFKLEATHRE